MAKAFCGYVSKSSCKGKRLSSREGQPLWMGNSMMWRICFMLVREGAMARVERIRLLFLLTN